MEARDVLSHRIGEMVISLCELQASLEKAQEEVRSANVRNEKLREAVRSQFKARVSSSGEILDEPGAGVEVSE